MKCSSVLPSTVDVNVNVNVDNNVYVDVNVNVQIMNVSVIFNLPNYVCKVQVHFVVLHVGRSNTIIMWQPVDVSIGPQPTPRRAPAPRVILEEEEEKTNKNLHLVLYDRSKQNKKPALRPPPLPIFLGLASPAVQMAACDHQCDQCYAV